nr:phospholipase A2 group V isoform X2 [Peromyscus maniculatus bairdii]
MPEILLLHKAQTPASGDLKARNNFMKLIISKPQIPSFHFREGCLRRLGCQGVVAQHPEPLLPHQWLQHHLFLLHGPGSHPHAPGQDHITAPGPQTVKALSSLSACRVGPNAWAAGHKLGDPDSDYCDCSWAQVLGAGAETRPKRITSNSVNFPADE